MILRHFAPPLAALFVVLWAGLSFAQDKSAPATDEAGQFVSIGELGRIEEPGGNGSQFVLLDESGNVVARLQQAPGVPLADLLGHEVGVTARTLVDGEVPLLLAENATSFGLIETSDPSVQLAALQEELPTGNAEEFAPIEYDVLQDDYVDGYVGAGVGCDSCGARTPSRCVCPCGLPGQFWIRAEYLIWWTRGMNTPPLVSTSPAGTLAGDAGVLGTPGTAVLYGNEEILGDSRSGGRFRLGKAWDDCGYLGFETDFFFLSSEDQNFDSLRVGPTIYARPFNNVDSGPDAQLIQFPGVVNGTVDVEADSSLWSIAPRFRINLACEQMPGRDPYYPCSPGGYRLDFLAGYRYMRLDDRLVIRENIATVDANDPTYFSLYDNFDTSNDFHGADLGLLWEGYRGPWSLELIGRVGIGTTRQRVAIAGGTTTTGMGQVIHDPGGLLALSSNMGDYSRDEFTILPEASITLGYQLSPRTRFLVGYTFIYWNNVVRAGDQIDTSVNTALIPNAQATTSPLRPAFAFRDTSFWAQGLSLGMEYRW